MIAQTARRSYASVRNYWINHPVVDWLLVLATYGGLVSLDLGLARSSSSEARYVWYQTVSGISAGLVGIAVTVATILWSITHGPRLKELMVGFGNRLNQLFFSSLLAIAATSLVSGLAIPLDHSKNAGWPAQVVDAMVLLLSLRSLRLMWLLGRVLMAIAVDSKEKQFEFERWTAPEINEEEYPGKLPR